MPLTRSIDDLETDIRYTADIGGTSEVARHSQANLFNLINRGIAGLHRKLTALIPDQRELSSTTVNTVASTATYALAADFFSLLSIHIDANGRRSWMTPIPPNERAALTDPSATYEGIPYYYRIQGSNLELFPTPTAVYSVTYYYVPNPDTLVTTETVDTVSRLDDWIIWYACKEVAKRDQNWALHDRCTADMAALELEIAHLARSRDLNAPPRISEGVGVDRYGRPR